MNPIPVFISAEDLDWKNRIRSAFQQRIAFELGDLDKVNLATDRFQQLIIDNCLHSDYTPKVKSPDSIRLYPNEMRGINFL